MPGSVWDHAADKQLLLSIIEIGSLSKIDWKQISQMLCDKDYSFTHEACRQHYQKIRKESKGGNANGGQNGNGSAATTPVKPKTGKKATPASRRVLKTFEKNANDDDDENMMIETPTKKRKLDSAKPEEKEEEDYGGFEGQNAAQFKIEDGVNPYVDLDGDEFYD